jgi:hypothetical protein
MEPAKQSTQGLAAYGGTDNKGKHKQGFDFDFDNAAGLAKGAAPAKHQNSKYLAAAKEDMDGADKAASVDGENGHNNLALVDEAVGKPSSTQQYALDLSSHAELEITLRQLKATLKIILHKLNLGQVSQLDTALVFFAIAD